MKVGELRKIIEGVDDDSEVLVYDTETGIHLNLFNHSRGFYLDEGDEWPTWEEDYKNVSIRDLMKSEEVVILLTRD